MANEVCEICGTIKVFKTWNFKLKMLKELSESGAYVYQCLCPCYLLDEIHTLRQYNIIMNDEDRKKFNAVKNRLFKFFQMSDKVKFKMSADVFDLCYKEYYDSRMRYCGSTDDASGRDEVAYEIYRDMENVMRMIVSSHRRDNELQKH